MPGAAAGSNRYTCLALKKGSVGHRRERPERHRALPRDGRETWRPSLGRRGAGDGPLRLWLTLGHQQAPRRSIIHGPTLPRERSGSIGPVAAIGPAARHGAADASTAPTICLPSLLPLH